MKLKVSLLLASLLILPAISNAAPAKCEALKSSQITTCSSLAEYLETTSLGKVKATWQRESAGWGASSCSSVDDVAYSFAKKDYVDIFRHYNQETGKNDAYCCVVETGDQLFGCDTRRG